MCQEQEKALGLLDYVYGTGVLNKRDYEDLTELISSIHIGQKWIEVSERLPKEGTVVLITNKKGNVKHGQYRGLHIEEKCDWWIWKKNRLEEVVAWMPLPEPYGSNNL